MDNGLNGKVVIVTGGLSGMGRAIAEGFVQQGSKVVVGDLAATADNASAGVVYQQTDVADADSLQRLIARTVETYGRLDVLVNNAGINGRLAPVAELDENDFDAVFRVNTRGVFFGMKYGLEQMAGQRGGVIINIASVQGVRPIYAGASVYAASKAAVVSMTRSAAHEYGQYGIRVVAVAPGPIDTPMLQKADPEGAIAESIPLGRIGTGEELANAVIWLADDAASYVSGALLTVDGAFIAA